MRTFGAARGVAAAILALGLLLPALGGCSMKVPASVENSAGPMPTPTESSGPATYSRTLPDVLTYEAGAGLDPEVWRVSWHTSKLWMGGYTYLFSAGPIRNGLWNFQADDSKCEITLTQSTAEKSGDDRSLSDDALSALTEIAPGDLRAHVRDSAADVAGAKARVQFRSVSTSDPGGTTSNDLTRVFEALDSELSLGVRCPKGQDAVEATGRLLESLTVEMVRVGDPVDFDESAALYEGTVPNWSDAMLSSDDAWKYEGDDHEEGIWGFQAADGSCRLEFQQGRLGDDWAEAGNDRTASDWLLGNVIDSHSWVEARDFADGRFSHIFPGNDIVANRYAVGRESSTSWAMSARAFLGTGHAFVLTVTCRSGDPLTILRKLDEKVAIGVAGDDIP